MILSKEQTNKLLKLIATAEPDDLDCDGCFERISEYAEAQLKGEIRSLVMKQVANHLTQCTCCAYEYRVLLDALSE